MEPLVIIHDSESRILVFQAYFYLTIISIWRFHINFIKEKDKATTGSVEQHETVTHSKHGWVPTTSFWGNKSMHLMRSLTSMMHHRGSSHICMRIYNILWPYRLVHRHASLHRHTRCMPRTCTYRHTVIVLDTSSFLWAISSLFWV